MRESTPPAHTGAELALAAAAASIVLGLMAAEWFGPQALIILAPPGVGMIVAGVALCRNRRGLADRLMRRTRVRGRLGAFLGSSEDVLSFGWVSGTTFVLLGVAWTGFGLLAAIGTLKDPAGVFG